MTDVVEQGGPEREPRLPPWARRAVLGVVVVVAAAVVVQSGLLVGEDPTRSQRRSTPSTTTSTNVDENRYVVMRDERQVVRYDEFGVAPGPRLPPDLPDDADLYVVPIEAARARILMVAGGALLRMQPGTETLADLGEAARIVDASSRLGQLVVQTGTQDAPHVVTVDAQSGQVVDRTPFFEDDPLRRGYVPVGVLSQFGVAGLVLRRGADGVSGDEVAVAWARGEVETGRRPELQLIGRHGRLVGVTDDWLLLLDGRCPGGACRLVVVSFDHDRFSLREVLPPLGWSFAAPPAGRPTRGPLIPVVRTGATGPEATALARLAAGGDRALLVSGSTGAVPEAGLVQREDGDIFFIRLGSGAIRRVARWRPDKPGEVSTLASMPPLAESARLVCVCDTTETGAALDPSP